MSHDQTTTSPFRKVSTAIWADKKVCKLSPVVPSGQAMFLMLLMGPATTNMPGVQPVGRLGFAEMLEWEQEAFDKAFQEVSDQGLAKADWKARFVFVPKAIQHNLPQSPNVVKSWASTWSRVPECDLKREAWETIYSALRLLGDSFAVAFKAACPLDPADSNAIGKDMPKDSDKPSGKPSRKATDNQEQEQEKEQEKEKDKPSAAPVDEDFESAWNAYPPRSGASKADSLKQWKARIKAGANAEQIIAGVRRYAAYVKAKGTEDGFIKQPATFFGPGKHYESDWSIPVRSSGPAQHSNHQGFDQRNYGPGGKL